jgi:hypothetical protein
VDYTGYEYVTVSNMTPPSAGEVESRLVRDLMLDLIIVQAAVDSNSDIGQNVRVEEAVVGDDSVVALSDFPLVIRSDDINVVNQDQLARTLEDYLMTGLMQDSPVVKARIEHLKQKVDYLAPVSHGTRRYVTTYHYCSSTIVCVDMSMLE